MGQIKLYNNKCENILKELNIDWGKAIFVSDPPFNIGYKYNTYKDKIKEIDYYNWLKSIFSKYKHVLIHYPEGLHKYSIAINKSPERVVSWVYNSNTPRQHRDIAFYGVKPIFKQVLQPYKNLKDKRIQQRIKNGFLGCKIYDWWNENQVKNVSKEKTDHPCQMPLKVMKNIIGILPKDSIIIDPFMGSGTTGVACKELGYKFIGIEMDKKYYNISKERMQYNERKNI